MLRPEWSMPSLFDREPERFASAEDPRAPKRKRRRKTAAVPGLEVEHRGNCTVLSLRDRDAWRRGKPSR